MDLSSTSVDAIWLLVFGIVGFCAGWLMCAYYASKFYSKKTEAI